jgi:hypothetical protein
MEEYWKVNPSAPGLEIETGSKWSDLLATGLSPFEFVVSQRLIESLQREGIAIFRKTRMPIHRIRPKRLKDLPPPAYYVLEAVPGLAVDWSAMAVLVGEDGRPRINAIQLMELPPFVFDWSTWSGLDLFSLTNLGSPMIPFCTATVKELAEKEKWSNVEFELVGS